MQKKSFWEQYKMPILLLGGIAIGALIGIIAPDFGTKLKPLGDIFLNLMFTIVVPLVFASITSAVGAMANMKRLGKILGSTLLTFLATGAFAGACVLIWVNLFNPAAGASIQMGEAEMGQMQSAGDMLVGALTVGDFSQLLSKSNMLPLIIFSMIFGFCVSSISRNGEENIMSKWLTCLNDVIMKFVGVIMKVAPSAWAHTSPISSPCTARSSSATTAAPWWSTTRCACCMWSFSSRCMPCSPPERPA